jgi:hypothetical protein
VIEDETPVEPVDEPQPEDENGDVIAPPEDDAPEAPDAGDPPTEDELELDAETEAKATLVTEVIEATVVTEVIGGTTEPEVLDSGDVLPEHRRLVDGV